MSAPVMIQAGGKGTRLRPYTTVLPKPLMPIGELPVLEIVIRQLRHYGFDDLWISLGHLGSLIQAYFGDGQRWGARIRYVFEDQPLGTIGPVRLMPRPSVPFMVMNGDLLTSIHYDEMYAAHVASGAQLTVGVYNCKVPVSLGVLDIDQRAEIVGFREKPTLTFWASMGVYVLSPDVWDLVPADRYFGFDTLMDSVLRGELRARVHRFDGIWLDIGRPEDYANAVDVLEASRELLIPG